MDRYEEEALREFIESQRSGDSLDRSTELIEPELEESDVVEVQSPEEALKARRLSELKYMEDEAKKARQREALLEMFKGIQKGGARIGQSLAGRYSGKFDPDTSVYDSMTKPTAKEAERLEASVKAKQKQLKEEIDEIYKRKKEAKTEERAEAKEEREAEKFRQEYEPMDLTTDLQKKLYERYKVQTDKEVEPMSLSQLEKVEKALRNIDEGQMSLKEKLQLQATFESIGLRKQRLAHDKDKEAAQQNRFDVSEKRRVANFGKGYRDKLLSDPRFKDLAKQEQAFQQIPALIDAAKEQNQAAVAALGTRLARAMGEVGVLTDQDVVRYLGTVSYGRKLLNWYSKGMQGTLDIDSLEDIQGVADIMQHLTSTQVRPIYEEYASAMMANYPGDISDEKALEILGAPGFVKPVLKDTKAKYPTKSEKKESKNKAQPKKAPYGETVEKEGKTYKWNSVVGKYQLLPGQ